MSDAHYTATIEVTKTTHTAPATPSGSYGRGEVRPEPKREVIDVARVVIRAESLETLRDKVGRHVELIE